MMKATYVIRQKASYVQIFFYAQTETEMLNIVETLSKGKPKNDTDEYEVIVSVNIEKDNEIDNF